ncbi:MAG: leucine-rich repeat domain-containing protein, partial [Lewinella sp.]
MSDTPIKYTPETGFRRAEELIAECIATKSTFLDLGNLALEEVPEGLGECVWLLELNLGDHYRFEEGKDKWSRGQGDQSNQNHNKLLALPEQLNKLLHLEKISLIFLRSVNDLTPLSKSSLLTYLNCIGTAVNDLSPLSGLTALNSLDCGNTQVNDLSPLSGLT